MLSIVRSIIGVLAILGFVTAVVLLMLVEWCRIRERDLGFVPIFHRLRRIVTGILMIGLLGLSFYGWWFMHDSMTIQSAEVFLKSVFSLFAIIILSLLWDCVTVYRSMNSFFDRMNQSRSLEDVRESVDQETPESVHSTGESHEHSRNTETH